MDTFEVGDLVRDKLNKDDLTYGLGLVVAVDPQMLSYEPGEEAIAGWEPRGDDVTGIPPKRYDVYFTKFERTITFVGDYLEKV